ncbi:hypothetical protein [Streptomyces scopuliridis]|uniref:hypothetical protein n=1 Tax=Streptomyces scopuliridis TaxID=452529 RepID=UPI0036C30A13
MTESAPEPFARAFRLRQHGQLLHGCEFPEGPAVVLDGPDIGVSVAPSLRTLLLNYPRAHVEWANEIEDDEARP